MNEYDAKEDIFISGVIRKMLLMAGKLFKKKLDRNLSCAVTVNNLTLQKILRINCNTEHIRKHNLRALTVEEFRKKIPLCRYDAFGPEIRRMINGEKNVLCAEPVISYSLTSGTTGSGKHIPVTGRQQAVVVPYMSMIVPFIAQNHYLQSQKQQRCINLMCFAGTAETSAGAVPVGTATGNALNRMKNMIPHFYLSPVCVYRLDNSETAHYLHALYGLKARYVQTITAVFCSHITTWFTRMEKHWDALVADIEAGRITEGIELQSDTRQRLEKFLEPDPVRARELRAARAAGFEGIASRIWPGFAYINTVATSNFAVYRASLTRYIGTIPVYDPLYAASEALIGLGLEPDKPGFYTLVNGAAYFEFIPAGESEHPCPPVLDLGQIQAGCCYEIVITNWAGLYRYRIGDVIKVEGFNQKTPVISFCYREGTVLNIAGEKSTEAHVRSAMEALARAGSAPVITLQDFTATVDWQHSCYVFYIEAGHDKAVDDWNGQGNQILDKALRAANMSYHNHRNHHMLNMPVLKIMAPGTFQRFLNLLVNKNPGKNPNQVKIPKSIFKQEYIDLLESSVLN